jgi:plasmid stabilization system protein ParE
MATNPTVKLTANFELTLAKIEEFLLQQESSEFFDKLLDDLTDTVLPNLERFPHIGRSFLGVRAGSAETTQALGKLRLQLTSLGEAIDLREYVMQDYLVLYLVASGGIYLLSIRHQRQLSFDLPGFWESGR